MRPYNDLSNISFMGWLGRVASATVGMATCIGILGATTYLAIFIPSLLPSDTTLLVYVGLCLATVAALVGTAPIAKWITLQLFWVWSMLFLRAE